MRRRTIIPVLTTIIVLGGIVTAIKSSAVARGKPATAPQQVQPTPETPSAAMRELRSHAHQLPNGHPVDRMHVTAPRANPAR